MTQPSRVERDTNPPNDHLSEQDSLRDLRSAMNDEGSTVVTGGGLTEEERETVSNFVVWKPNCYSNCHAPQ